ncbi:zinc-dependent alcohol dehydrogenase [Arvimicrobium flavum]|uniref:zinc-dependent alcohol dehydrogenase n=1 Tax=Arvimicrobium flavum TaxID=3393320 RepID=UPI00237AF1AA|nr:zinc-binding alcohol dehydrogenase [Mesorhizobium shangrilense]
MPDYRTIRSLGVEAPGRPYFFCYEEGPLAEGQVRLDALYSGFSAGTELTFLKDTNPYLRSRWDGERGVFVDGEPSVRFPVPFLGYMEVARVADSRADSFVAADVVAASYGHKSGHTADPFQELVVGMPNGIHPILGIFVAQMGPIAANGILHADAETFGPEVRRLGESLTDRPIVVFGGGTVGLLTALFAQAAGAEIVLAEPSAWRRDKAEALGLTAMTEAHAWQHAKARWHHGGQDRGADFAFQTRARSESLHDALRALRPQGTVIDLAFYQGAADRTRLGEEFHHNGLSLRCAQVGRVPRELAHRWDRRRLSAETLVLLERYGQAICREMITQIVPVDDAPSFLSHLVSERPEFLQIVFSFE